MVRMTITDAEDLIVRIRAHLVTAHSYFGMMSSDTAKIAALIQDAKKHLTLALDDLDSIKGNERG
jgi:hypothetical protein